MSTLNHMDNCRRLRINAKDILEDMGISRGVFNRRMKGRYFGIREKSFGDMLAGVYRGISKEHTVRRLFLESATLAHSKNIMTGILSERRVKNGIL